MHGNQSRPDHNRGIPCHASNSGSSTRSGCAIPEIDGQGVVFNAHYLTYFDTTITEYFRALGYDQYADAKQTGEDFHVVKSVIEYKAPARFDWELDIGARVTRDRQFKPHVRARNLPERRRRGARDR